MQLQKREKNMLIGLSIVAIISAIMLYRIYYPSSEEVIPADISSSTTKSSDTPNKATTSSGSRGGTRGGSSVSGRGGTGDQTVSLQEFESHSSLKNCWVLLNGEVFDISNFLVNYGDFQDSIMPFCGTVGFEAGFIEGNKSLAESVKIESQKIGTIS